MGEAHARELTMEFASYVFAVGNLRTVFERSGTFDQFRSHWEQDAAQNGLVRECLQVLDWIEASHSQQKSLLEIGLAEHELLQVRACVPILLTLFVSSVTTAESGHMNAFVDSLDPAAPGPYGEVSSRVLKLLESATNLADAATDVLRDNDHSLALRADGSVVAWGKNGYQQLQGPDGSTAEFVEWEGDGYYLRSLNSRIDPYEADYGRRSPSGATRLGAGTDTSFEGFVDRRLNQQPRPTKGDAKSPRYWAGAGEVMLDILLAATSPSNSDLVLTKIHQDMASGDSVAPLANQLLELWASKSATGDTTSLSESVTDELAPATVRAYRGLTILYAGAADADRLATIDAVLSRRMTPLMSTKWPGLADGDALASVLKVMLDAAVKDVRA